MPEIQGKPQVSPHKFQITERRVGGDQHGPKIPSPKYSGFKPTMRFHLRKKKASRLTLLETRPFAPTGAGGFVVAVAVVAGSDVVDDDDDGGDGVGVDVVVVVFVAVAAMAVAVGAALA